MQVHDTRRPARIERFEGPPGSIAAFFAGCGARCGVGAPITVEGGLWGVLAIVSTDPERLPAGSRARHSTIHGSARDRGRKRGGSRGAAQSRRRTGGVATGGDAGRGCGPAERRIRRRRSGSRPPPVRRPRIRGAIRRRRRRDGRRRVECDRRGAASWPHWSDSRGHRERAGA